MASRHAQPSHSCQLHQRSAVVCVYRYVNDVESKQPHAATKASITRQSMIMPTGAILHQSPFAAILVESTNPTSSSAEHIASRCNAMNCLEHLRDDTGADSEATLTHVETKSCLQRDWCDEVDDDGSVVSWHDHLRVADEIQRSCHI
mmetsp:Transcript_14507/g.39990  ORF Transcript_14507/g.39990 Transcript_14507/m.39990 type:complete len:147 (+) Transcript_14507:1097-1537(+)